MDKEELYKLINKLAKLREDSILTDEEFNILLKFIASAHVEAELYQAFEKYLFKH